MDINKIVTTIQNLCNQNDISIDKMLKKCNLSPSVVDNMKKGSVPYIDKILPIAEYFNVSVDYLLGYTPNKQRTSNSLERLLIFAEKLTDEQIDTIIAMGTAFLDTRK